MKKREAGDDGRDHRCVEDQDVTKAETFQQDRHGNTNGERADRRGEGE